MKSADIFLMVSIVAALVLMGILVFGSEGVDGDSTGGRFAESDLPGEPRDLDLELLRRRIRQKELSDREALYWRR